MTISPDGREGPDGPGSALPDGLVVPDDASSLALDRLAYQRELAQLRRRARWERMFLTKRFHRYGISGPIVALCLSVVFIFAALLAFVVPSGGNTRARALPLASTAAKAGTLGSLLPAEKLVGAGRTRIDLASRDLRPGVVLLIPTGCEVSTAAANACADSVRGITATARDYNLTTWIIGSPAINNLVELATAPETADTYAIPLIDSTGAVTSPFPLTTSPTAIFIAPNGVITSIVSSLTIGTDVTPAFNRLTTGLN